MSVTTRSKAKASVGDHNGDSPVQPAKANPMEKLRYKLLEKVAAGTPIIEKLQVFSTEPDQPIFTKLMPVNNNSLNFINNATIFICHIDVLINRNKH
jgi:hypothetical protein